MFKNPAPGPPHSLHGPRGRHAFVDSPPPRKLTPTPLELGLPPLSKMVDNHSRLTYNEIHKLIGAASAKIQQEFAPDVLIAIGSVPIMGFLRYPTHEYLFYPIGGG